VLRWLDDLHVATVLCIRERARLQRRDVRNADVELPTPPSSACSGSSCWANMAAAFNGQVERVVSHFVLDAQSIARVANGVLSDAAPELPSLWLSTRHDARSSLDALAERLPRRAGWDRLVLPAQQMHALREIVAQVRRRARVYETWGFARDGRGLGISALSPAPAGPARRWRRRCSRASSSSTRTASTSAPW